jgi:hypothetical protein
MCHRIGQSALVSIGILGPLVPPFKNLYTGRDQKGEKVMPRPRKPGVVAVKIRLAQSLVDKLEAAAKQHGDSFNAEAAKRLGKSFAEEEAFGGEKGRGLLYLMASAFVTAGERAAGGRKLSSWIKEPEPYAAAMSGVIYALIMGQPDATLHKCLAQLDGVKGRIASHFVNKETSHERKHQAARSA